MNPSIVVLSARWTRAQVRGYIRDRRPDFIVIRRTLGPGDTYLYAVPWEDFSDILQLEAEQGPAGSLEQIFDLHEHTSSPKVGPDDPAPPWQLAVVVQGDQVLGVVMPDRSSFDLDSGNLIDPGHTANGGRESTSGSIHASGIRPPPPPPFSAQPRLDAPASASAGAVFAVTVGFRPETSATRCCRTWRPSTSAIPSRG